MENNEEKTDILLDVKILSDFLGINKNKNKFGMNVTMVQGFLYSLVTLPCLIMPSDWMYVIFGGFPEFQSTDQHEKTIAAILQLHNCIKDRLLLGNKADLFLWEEGGQVVALNKSSDLAVSNFCSGYIKGYLLDPILQDVCEELPDFSLAFFLSIIRVCDDRNTEFSSDDSKKKSNINDVMRKTLQSIIADNYMLWSEVRELNLPKTYFPSSLYK